MTLVLCKSLNSSPSAWCRSKALSLRGFRPNPYSLPGLRTSWPPLRTAVSLITLFCCLLNRLRPALLWPHGLEPARVLCPWDFPGKNTRVSCHFLLQGIFLSQGSNLCLLHCRQILYLWATGEAHTYQSGFRLLYISGLGDFFYFSISSTVYWKEYLFYHSQDF